MNRINFCRCAAINTNLDVQAIIIKNSFNLNEVGIEIYNNQSHLIENKIERSHENGIKITGTNRSQLCTAKIWKNTINACGYNGIVIQGGQCNPDVRGNIIKQNRKAGIKLTEDAIAHIGGTEKADIKFIPDPQRGQDTANNNTFMTAKKEAIRYFKGGSIKGGGAADTVFSEAMEEEAAEVVQQTPDDLQNLDYNEITVTAQIRVKSFPNANVISHNYNQGILIVEGSSAEIIANEIKHNIKANIALGGKETGKTRIMYNYIKHSKSGEGIFVVEGEKELLIEDNYIEHNQDGVVIVNSDGKIKGNTLQQNTRSGVLSAGRSTASVIGNIIEESNTGVLIKDPSELILRKNQIRKNNIQVEMEKKSAKRFWPTYQKENPKIVGAKTIPQSTCTIF